MLGKKAHFYIFVYLYFARQREAMSGWFVGILARLLFQGSLFIFFASAQSLIILQR